MVKRIIEAVADLIRWAEPWAYEEDDLDPLLWYPSDATQPMSVWA